MESVAILAILMIGMVFTIFVMFMAFIIIYHLNTQGSYIESFETREVQTSQNWMHPFAFWNPAWSFCVPRF